MENNNEINFGSGAVVVSDFGDKIIFGVNEDEFESASIILNRKDFAKLISGLNRIYENMQD